MRALGLELLAEERYASDTVTAVRVPDEIAVGDLSRMLREEYDVVIAAGQGKLATKIFRIGHLGWLDEAELAACFEALKAALTRLGFAPAADADLPAIG